MKKKAVVTGAAGFIGGHMCRYLKERGYWVYAIDRVDSRYGDVPCDKSDWRNDLRDYWMLRNPFGGVDEVYAFAADMGGMGYISYNHFDIMWNNANINLNTARYAAQVAVPRLFFASSACVYPEHLQMGDGRVILAENDAWNGKPDTAYGVEKLFSEDIYHYLTEYAGQIRIARYHNIFGPRGSWNDGREKLPAAACRKIAQIHLAATSDGVVTVWGDGEQVRSFCYIEDCLEMTYLLMHSNYDQPLNIGSDVAVTVNEVYDMVADIAGLEIKKKHLLNKPQGVRYRNMDAAKMRDVLGYELQWSLRDGLDKTYRWVYAKEKAR